MNIWPTCTGLMMMAVAAAAFVAAAAVVKMCCRSWLSHAVALKKKTSFFVKQSDFFCFPFWGAIAIFLVHFFPLVLFHLVWVVATDDPREREKTEPPIGARSKVRIWTKFSKFLKGGPKNRLGHPELWGCHFRRFPDLAIFQSPKDPCLHQIPGGAAKCKLG